MPTYQQKLQNPLWQKKRLQIFERDNWKCQKCGDASTQLEIHHLEYFDGHKPWEYPDDMLTTLCAICHEQEQQRPKYETDLITSLKMNGFLSFHVWNLATKLYTDKRFRDHLKSILSK